MGSPNSPALSVGGAGLLGVLSNKAVSEFGYHILGNQLGEIINRDCTATDTLNRECDTPFLKGGSSDHTTDGFADFAEVKVLRLVVFVRATDTATDGNTETDTATLADRDFDILVKFLNGFVDFLFGDSTTETHTNTDRNTATEVEGNIHLFHRADRYDAVILDTLDLGHLYSVNGEDIFSLERPPIPFLNIVVGGRVLLFPLWHRDTDTENLTRKAEVASADCSTDGAINLAVGKIDDTFLEKGEECFREIVFHIFLFCYIQR